MPDKKLTPMMELCDMLAIQNPLRNQMIEKERQMVIDSNKHKIEKMKILFEKMIGWVEDDFNKGLFIEQIKLIEDEK